MAAAVRSVHRITSTERRARKSHTCDGCGERIAPGDMYLEHRMPPSRELGNTTVLVKHECFACAGRLGRRSDQALEHHATPLFDVEGIA